MCYRADRSLDIPRSHFVLKNYPYPKKVVNISQYVLELNLFCSCIKCYGVINIHFQINNVHAAINNTKYIVLDIYQTILNLS